MHYLNLYSSFLLEIHTFNYNNLTDVFDYFYAISDLKVSIRSCAFIYITIMLGVKLDVNWCSDKL